MATPARPAARLAGAGAAAALVCAVAACAGGTPEPSESPGATALSPPASPSPSDSAPPMESSSAEPTGSAEPSESSPPEVPPPGEWVITPEAFGPIELGADLESVAEQLGGTISNPSADQDGAECRVATDFAIEDFHGDLQVTAVDSVVVAVKWGINQSTSIDADMELPATADGVTLASPDAEVSDAMGPEALVNGWGPSSGVAWAEREGENLLVAESTTLSPAEQPSSGFIGWLYVFNDEDGDTFPECQGN